MDIKLNLLSWRIAPVLADLIGLVLFWALVPRLTTRFQQKATVNALIIGGVFLLFCVAVVFVRRLQGETEGAYIDPGGLSVFLGLMFGILVSFMMAEATGLFENLDTMDLDANNPVVSVGILAIMLLWLVLIFLYPGILMAKIKPAIGQASGSYAWIELLSLLGINLMVTVTAAHWQAYFADTTPYEGLGLGAKLLIFAATFVFFLLFYAPPRLLFLNKIKHPSGIVTFLLQLGYIVWQTLTRVAWR